MKRTGRRFGGRGGIWTRDFHDANVAIIPNWSTRPLKPSNLAYFQLLLNVKRYSRFSPLLKVSEHTSPFAENLGGGIAIATESVQKHVYFRKIFSRANLASHNASTVSTHFRLFLVCHPDSSTNPYPYRLSAYLWFCRLISLEKRRPPHKIVYPS